MKIYFVDLDDTLIDTSGFKDRMFKTICKISGISIGILKSIYEDLRVNGQLERNWLSDFIRKISLSAKVQEKLLTKDIFGLIKTMKLNRKVLHHVLGLKANKFILTAGDTEFQKAKIVHFGFSGYFDGIIFVPGQKCDFLLSLIHENRLKIAGRYFDEVEIIDDKKQLLGCLTEYDFIKILSPGDIK